MNGMPLNPTSGRGALSNPEGRFESVRRLLDLQFAEHERLRAEGAARRRGSGPGTEGAADTREPNGRDGRARGAIDGDSDSDSDSDFADEPAGPLAPRDTEVRVDPSRSIIARNRSPDVPFEQSINPYRGCEHGCIYCFARPGHSFLGLSPGLDFERRILCKPAAPQLLERELSKPRYRCRTIALGTNTDPYQPAERRLRITRGLLEVFLERRHPVSILTKSSAIVRDLDLLSDLAELGLVSVNFSLPTLDESLKRTLEPRAAAPRARLRALHALASVGVPTGVMVAPVIPALTDHEMERILRRAAQAGARTAGYILLRLPYEVAPLFREWLRAHYPERFDRVMNRLQEMRGGQDYDARFGVRKTGLGPWAKLLAARFEAACRRFHLNEQRLEPRTDLFRSKAASKPTQPPPQGDLFAA